MFKRFAICVSAYLTVGVMSLPLSVVIATTQTLENYYVYFRAPGVSSYSLRSISSDFPPAVVSDGFDPGHDIISAGLFLTINRFIDHDISSDYPCFNGSGLEVPYMVTDDTFTFNAPTRQRTWDGGQYDASAMVNLHNGQPWATYFWGYRLGLVPSQADWNPLNLANAPGLYPWIGYPDPIENVGLMTLPPPWIEDDIVEYVNQSDFPKQPGGQFFYAVLTSDKAALDAVPAWKRTGKSFKSGGYVSVCRFYGGRNGGPNTHFHSADADECDGLKKVAALSYEGQTFAVNMPMRPKTAAQMLPGALRDCPVKSKPLYRLYNNASAPGANYVSNHRYVTERADVAVAVAKGWVDEGHAMCVPE